MRFMISITAVCDFPVPGGPCIIAIADLRHVCMAIICDWLSTEPSVSFSGIDTYKNNNYNQLRLCCPRPYWANVFFL